MDYPEKVRIEYDAIDDPAIEGDVIVTWEFDPSYFRFLPRKGEVISIRKGDNRFFFRVDFIEHNFNKNTLTIGVKEHN